MNRFAEWDRKRDEIIFTLEPGTNVGYYVTLITLSDGEAFNDYSLGVNVKDYIPLPGEEDEDTDGSREGGEGNGGQNGGEGGTDEAGENGQGPEDTADGHGNSETTNKIESPNSTNSTKSEVEMTEEEKK